MFDELNDEIQRSGGTYVKLNRKEHGVLEGVILDAEVRAKTFEGQEIVSRKTGKVRKEWVFTLQTDRRDDGDDDGVRKYAANEGAQFAIRSAVQAAGGKLEKGGTLKIAVKNDPPSSTQQAEYQARYEAPKATAVSDALDDDAPPF